MELIGLVAVAIFFVSALCIGVFTTVVEEGPLPFVIWLAGVVVGLVVMYFFMVKLA